MNDGMHGCHKRSIEAASLPSGVRVKHKGRYRYHRPACRIWQEQLCGIRGVHGGNRALYPCDNYCHVCYADRREAGRYPGDDLIGGEVA